MIAVNEAVMQQAGYSLYDAQLAAAEALKRRLDNSHAALLVAECGIGKSKIGSAALYAHQLSKAAKNKKTIKTFNVVICPSHIAKNMGKANKLAMRD